MIILEIIRKYTIIIPYFFTKSKQLKHQIIMQVAKDSRKGKPFAMEGIPDTNDFGPDKNLSKSIDVSAGYTAGSDFTVA